MHTVCVIMASEYYGMHGASIRLVAIVIIVLQYPFTFTENLAGLPLSSPAVHVKDTTGILGM